MIQPHPSAPDGQVSDLLNYSISDFPPTACVLCRLNAPLVALAFGFIRRGVGVRILGRELGTALLTLVRSAKASSIEELRHDLLTKRNRELARARRHENQSSAAAIEDKFNCLNFFLDHAKSIDELTARITSVFDETKRGLLTLATIHKSKGLEWETVFLLDKSLIPSRWATQEWQRRQETNLLYVAITRAKLNLFFIESDQWRDEPEAKQ